MAQTIQILRTTTNNPPPTLLPGALSAELGTETKLWIGAAAGNRLLLSTDPTDITLSGGAIIASAAPNAMPGSLWWDSNIGQLYIRYFDGNSTAWVSASTGTSVAIPIAVASGGTGAITAPAALTNLGAVAKAGDTITGNLIVNGELLVPASGFFQADGASFLNGATRLGATQITGVVESTAQFIRITNGSSPRFVLQNTVAPAHGYAVTNSNFRLQFETVDAAGTTADILGAFNDVGALTIYNDLTVHNASTPTISVNATYTTLASPGASNQAGSIVLGGTGDPTMYYRNNTHRFNNRDYSAEFVNFSVSGTFNVSGSWTAYSDGALKEGPSGGVVEPYTRGLEAVLALEPCRFRYKAGTPFTTATEPSEVRVGLIAEQVKPVIPEIIGEATGKVHGEDRTLATLTPTDLVYVLINAVKELNVKVEALAPAAPAARR